MRINNLVKSVELCGIKWSNWNKLDSTTWLPKKMEPTQLLSKHIQHDVSAMASWNMSVSSWQDYSAKHDIEIDNNKHSSRKEIYSKCSPNSMKLEFWIKAFMLYLVR